MAYRGCGASETGNALQRRSRSTVERAVPAGIVPGGNSRAAGISGDTPGKLTDLVPEALHGDLFRPPHPVALFVGVNGAVPQGTQDQQAGFQADPSQFVGIAKSRK